MPSSVLFSPAAGEHYFTGGWAAEHISTWGSCYKLRLLNILPSSDRFMDMFVNFPVCESIELRCNLLKRVANFTERSTYRDGLKGGPQVL